MLNLNLPSYNYFIKKERETLYIQDILKGHFLSLSPEEWVRQHMVNYLLNYKNVPKTMMSIESSLKYGKLGKRTDIIVYGKTLQPLLIIECKASHIRLSEKVLLQIAVYNSVLKAPYVGVTNGLNHLYWHYKGQGEALLLDELPDYSSLLPA